MSAMRVCHLSSTTLESKYFNTLGRGLAAAGVTLFGATLTAPAPPSWLARADDYLFLDAPARWHYPRAAVRLARWLRAKKIDVLQTHLFDAAVVGLVGGRLARVPFLVGTRHHSDFHFVSGTRAHVAIDRWSALHADRVVVLGHAVKAHLVTRERVPAEKIDVIVQGFDFDALRGTDADGRRVRAEFGLEGAFVVGVVAAFYPGKGHAHLFAAARMLVDEIPNLKVLVVGAGDPAAIGALAAEHGLGGRVVAAGFRRDVSACLRAMDVAVHPSLSEAFCQAVVEALAAERPVVATDVGGAAEAIADGEGGILVPPADPDAIAAAIRRLHRDPALAHRLAAQGHQAAVATFAVDRMVAAQIDIYQRGLASRAVPAPTPSEVARG
ncbi:MAG TPA: glycosyltransferase [Vicinamibacterales bacterium]|nr:glycosyltransferase [Vicinamibacterales bacterium]